MRRWTVALTMALLTVQATASFAQGSNPSADQIIKSLTPTGDVSKAGSRGIRLRTPATTETETPPAAIQPVATAARPAVTAAPARTDAAPAVNLTVNFPSGSAELTPQAMQTLDALGTALSSAALSQYRFRVEGHTDTVGSPEANRILSERRAEAVVGYICSKFGVDASRLIPVGMGSDKPLIATGEQVPEPRNRRVNVVNLGT